MKSKQTTGKEGAGMKSKQTTGKGGCRYEEQTNFRERRVQV